MITIIFFYCCSLLSLINPVGAIPVFLSLTEYHEKKWVKKQILKTSFNVFLICIISFFFGKFIITFFGISIDSLKIAGGMIIARSGFMLLNAKHKKDIGNKIKMESLHKENISFTPLAMPLLSGPGSISFLISQSLVFSSNFNQICYIVLSILIVSISIFLIFNLARKILVYIGQAGLQALSKIMGFVVLSIGIELIVSTVVGIAKSLLEGSKI